MGNNKDQKNSLILTSEVGANNCWGWKIYRIVNWSVTSLLLNTDERIINSICLLKNWMWHILSGGFLVNLGNYGLYGLDLMLLRVAMHHCIYLTWDVKLAVS